MRSAFTISASLPGDLTRDRRLLRPHVNGSRQCCLAYRAYFQSGIDAISLTFPYRCRSAFLKVMASIYINFDDRLRIRSAVGHDAPVSLLLISFNRCSLIAGGTMQHRTARPH